MILHGWQPFSWQSTFTLVALIGMAIAVSACTETGSSLDPSTKLEAKMAPVFTTPIAELKLGHDETVLFGIKACKVYRSMQIGSTPGNWELLFKPAPYPLPQHCVRERLEFDGEYIQIEIGTQAMGAGGCCTNYAAYRSRDGENWEIRPATSIREWRALD
ncbi:hypothetical protein [Parahaliea mediterranea]|uniref:Uncharacterized protein n=1 Tax=Parahaliea mediterranea TaxID=651086 RepID=A0A939DF36_9GAMM|nr:hypothetical protein [Parahaliea mediterranea]MBN7796960.1 hypothetical protein [Parahaliea mediterranea]